jgi:phage FluMu gp28-like protein
MLPDSDSKLSKHFMPHQVAWIQAEKAVHDQHKQAVALAEKSVRIGWTYADAFKNVRKRLWFKERDYLFATKDYASALEYVRQCYKFAEVFDLTRSVISHGEESLSLNRLDDEGRPSSFTEEVKVGVIKFDNGSRIIAFSASPQAMSVYGGDVGLDEFAKHPNARLLWETAQGRVTWNYDLAIWSSHDGEDTLFNEFAQEARAACCEPAGRACSPLRAACLPDLGGQRTDRPTQASVPWNIYFRVTLPDAISFGLVDTINRARGTSVSAQQFLADCRSRARDEEIFEQSYLCNPLGTVSNHIVEWSPIERCRADYEMERVHLEAEEIGRRFGQFSRRQADRREEQIEEFLSSAFGALFGRNNTDATYKDRRFRLGFDVAASGQGDLATIYVDEAKGDDLWLRGLFTCRTEDWHFLKTVLFYFLEHLPHLQAAGDESGLGRQICWEAAEQHGGRFVKVNFGSKKHDLGFTIMNQLSVAEKHFPRSEADVAADYFALRKTHTGTRWAFSEGRNTLNAASHCDIAWAGALATHAHVETPCSTGCLVAYDYHDGVNAANAAAFGRLSPEERLLWSEDPRIWGRWGR